MYQSRFACPGIRKMPETPGPDFDSAHSRNVIKYALFAEITDNIAFNVIHQRMVNETPGCLRQAGWSKWTGGIRTVSLGKKKM